MLLNAPPSLLASVLVLLLFLFPSNGSPSFAAPAPRTTGTYSDMHYIEKAGDVLGHEIKIVFTGSSFQGAMQIAQGAPGELALVNIKVDGTQVSFSIPEKSAYAGQFQGVIEGDFLQGEFRFASGYVEKVKLPRHKSYWD